MNDHKGHMLPFSIADLFREKIATDLELAQQERDKAVARAAELEREVGQREEAAYRHGLGDRAQVLDDNRMLAAALAILIDRRRPGNLRGGA